jgi:CBS domain containing-hemolysin-like protein
MISGGSRPFRKIMIPRPKIKTTGMKFTRQQILDIALCAQIAKLFSSKGRLDNNEGLLRAKGAVYYLIDNK